MIYLADRKRAKVFRTFKKDISTAVRDGEAAWALDYDTLRILARRGIRYVGVLMTGAGDDEIFLTCIDNFQNRDIARPRDYSGKGRGAHQAYLPFQYFHRKFPNQPWRRSDLCEPKSATP